MVSASRNEPTFSRKSAVMTARREEVSIGQMPFKPGTSTHPQQAQAPRIPFPTPRIPMPDATATVVPGEMVVQTLMSM